MPMQPERLDLLSALTRKVLWLSSWTIHHANHVRPNADGLKVLEEIADALGISLITAKRDSAYAEAWLRRALSKPNGAA